MRWPCSRGCCGGSNSFCGTEKGYNFYKNSRGRAGILCQKTEAWVSRSPASLLQTRALEAACPQGHPRFGQVGKRRAKGQQEVQAQSRSQKTAHVTTTHPVISPLGQWAGRRTHFGLVNKAWGWTNPQPRRPSTQDETVTWSGGFWRESDVFT